VLADWAISQGLERTYLQAKRTNAAALKLYRRAGFEELCTYHYRTAAPRALTIPHVPATPVEQAFGVVRDHRGHVAVRYSCWFPTDH
jgi:hypothetical protein